MARIRLRVRTKGKARNGHVNYRLYTVSEDNQLAQQATTCHSVTLAVNYKRIKEDSAAITSEERQDYEPNHASQRCPRFAAAHPYMELSGDIQNHHKYLYKRNEYQDGDY